MAAQVEEAIKFRHILIPDEFVSMDDQGRRYGGDLRIGDLTGDGDVDFVVYQCLGGLKPSFIGAFNLAGDPLWSFGDHDASAFDEDGDGRLSASEVTRVSDGHTTACNEPRAKRSSSQ